MRTTFLPEERVTRRSIVPRGLLLRTRALPGGVPRQFAERQFAEGLFCHVRRQHLPWLGAQGDANHHRADDQDQGERRITTPTLRSEAPSLNTSLPSPDGECYP